MSILAKERNAEKAIFRSPDKYTKKNTINNRHTGVRIHANYCGCSSFVLAIEWLISSLLIAASLSAPERYDS